MIYAVILFCAVVIGYTYVGYPVLLWVLNRLGARNNQEASFGDQWPSATLVIPVHNGETVLRQKLTNCDGLQYEGDLSILFVLDGCNDGSEAVLRECIAQNVCRWPVSLFDSGERVGKEAALRQALGTVSSDVLVFSDADADFSSSTVAELVGPLTNPKVGVCCGRETHISAAGAGAGEGEGLFYRYENQIKKWQIPICSMTYVQGGVFSIKRELFPKRIKPGCTQDGVIAFETVLAGQAVRFVPTAVSTEPYKITVGQDFARRVRTVCRAFFAVACYAKLFLLPRTLWYGFHLMSHRVLRWFFIPLFLVMFVAAILGVGTYPELWLLITAQIGFLVLALIGWFIESQGRRMKLPYFAYYFVILHTAAFIAVVKTILGHRVVTWQPTETLPET
ncbi:glycosyltransferase [Rhodopirellula sp. JC740]|uniref:Glycosyltransferase n=1 Tax=Rhodopirellula halodulae TaxID=2894198 RepID=A0ABS8NFM5_9BACT|nr:glycosyltransferase [Rhodopirellula sp. JC740]MCC9642364.1 glycosyltransferase [Rhodopirellula sp. JC740]